MKFVAILFSLAVTAFAMTDAAPFTSVTPSQGADAFLDEIAAIDVEAAGVSNAYTVGCGWDGTYFWLSNGAGQAGAGTGMFYLLDHSGTMVDSFPQNDAPGWGLRDLCHDGTYMYGSDDTNIDYYDVASHEKIGAFTGPISPNRALAFDGTHFYTSSFSTDVYQLVWDGVSGSTATSTLWSNQATSAYGAAWDSINDCLWVTSANASGIIDQLAADGSLIDHHTVITDATWGGATMAYIAPVNELYCLEQGSPDTLHGYDVTPTSLERETWGSIKSLF